MFRFVSVALVMTLIAACASPQRINRILQVIRSGARTGSSTTQLIRRPTLAGSRT